MESENSSIETKVDQLLEYLAEEKSTSISQAAEELGVPEPTVEAWASALEDSGLITRSYSTTQGAILKVKDTEEAKEEVEDAEKKAGENIEEAREEISEEHEELEKVSNLLQGIEEAFKKRREISREMKNKIEKLREEEEVIEDHIENHEGDKLAEKEERALNVLEEAESRLEDLNIENKEKFKAKKENIEEEIDKLKTVKKGLEAIEKEEKN